MILTPRDISILALLANLSVAVAAQIRRQCFPNDSDGRITRRRLQILLLAGLIQKTRMEVVGPTMGGMCAPVYFSSRKGLEYLSVHFEDPTFLACSSQCPQWTLLAHAVAIADLHLIVNAAAALDSTRFSLGRWINEQDQVCPVATTPEERYGLYTLLNQKPRLVCAPDYLFTLTSGNQTKLFFGEVERGTNHPMKKAAECSPGFAEMARRKMHKRFSAEASDQFVVLITAPNAKLRDQLVKSFATKQEPSLYRFAALPDLSADTFFRGNVWHRCDGRVGPLIRPEAALQAVPEGVRNVSEPGQEGVSEVANTST